MNPSETEAKKGETNLISINKFDFILFISHISLIALEQRKLLFYYWLKLIDDFCSYFCTSLRLRDDT